MLLLNLKKWDRFQMPLLLSFSLLFSGALSVPHNIFMLPCFLPSLMTFFGIFFLLGEISTGTVWISLISGWFKCLIISPPRFGPHQSLYSQSNLITLTTKTIKSHCQTRLASPDNAVLHWCKQPMWGLVQMLSWSVFQNYVSAIQTCQSFKTENPFCSVWSQEHI